MDIKVPSMGESISEATIGQILKPSGSYVEMDDEILELETEKVNQVLYAQQAGVVSLSVNQGDVVKIGDVVGTITAGEKQEKEIEKEAPPAEKEEKPKKEKKETKPSAEKALLKEDEKPTPKVPGESIRISKEQYLEEISSEKKEQRISTPVPPPQPISTGERRETRRKMTKIRQVIARRLVEAQQTAAMLTTFNEVDMSQVMAAREKYKELFQKQYGVKLGFMSFFVKAAVAALEAFPDINSFIDGDEIVHREYYDIGIAVSTERGLFVPIVRDCDKLSVADIERSIEEYAIRAKEGAITVEELQGGGFTITNGGVFGSLLSTPILNPPQSGILGMHKIQKRPVVIGDQIVIRPMMYLALSYDHRIVDGKEAVSFLVNIKEHLEDPARFLLEI